MPGILQTLPIPGMQHSGWIGIEITDEFRHRTKHSSGMSDFSGNREDFYFSSPQKKQQKIWAKIVEGVMQ